MPIRLITAALMATAVTAMAACAASEVPPPAVVSTPQALAADMAGVAETRRDDADNSFREVRRVIAAPEGASDGGAWIYLQLNTGEERTLYRQRVMHFTARPDASVIQNTYSFSEPEKFADVLDTPARLDALSMDDLERSLATGCAVTWTYDANNGVTPWRDYVSQDDCLIFSERRQANIGIEGETRLGPRIIKQTERGYAADGTVLFGTEPGEFIELVRVSAE